MESCGKAQSLVKNNVCVPGLVAFVILSFKLDSYNGDYVFIFCNRKRDFIKVLFYDQNGFLLATQKLLDDMKFQWPRTPDEVKDFKDERYLYVPFRNYLLMDAE